MKSPFYTGGKGSPLLQYEDYDPECDYVMGIDTGEGLGQEDSVCDVYKKQTGYQVAKYCTNQQDPVEFSMSCLAIGRYYGFALAVIETNNSGGSVIRTFREQYNRSKIWRPSPVTKYKTSVSRQYGWVTTRGNRTAMIYDLKAGIKQGFIKISDATTLEQLKSFTRQKEGRLEHAGGEKDDHVFAAALAYQGFKGIRTREAKAKEIKEEAMTMGEYIKYFIGDMPDASKKRDLIIGEDRRNQAPASFLIR